MVFYYRIHLSIKAFRVEIERFGKRMYSLSSFIVVCINEQWNDMHICWNLSRNLFTFQRNPWSFREKLSIYNFFNNSFSFRIERFAHIPQKSYVNLNEKINLFPILTLRLVELKLTLPFLTFRISKWIYCWLK